MSRALERFLGKHTRCDALYVLGDLFEAWVGDDDDAPLAIHTAGTLRAFRDAGPALYLMHGNRDFLLGQQFCARAGATLLPDPTVIDLYGTPTLLMHGDSLCTTDVDYQAFRKQARMLEWQADMLGRSLVARRELAVQLRTLSRESGSNKPQDIVDVTPAEVARVLNLHGVRRLIHGHTHRPARHVHAEGERLVLGDWAQQGWAIEASAVGLRLHDFPI